MHRVQRIHAPTTLLLAMLVIASVRAPKAGANPIDLGTRRDLMVDNFLVDRLEGAASLKLHAPTPQEIVVVHDEPWEGCGSGYHTIFKDDAKFRMYYKAWQIGVVEPRPTGDERLFICYAESDDGIHWTKPNLGLHEYNGSTANNIIVTEVAGGQPHDFTVFKDQNPDSPPESRYKAVGYGYGAGKGLYAMKSADGIHWTTCNDGKPILTGHRFDTQNIAFWDPNLSKYRVYIRDYVPATSHSPGRRSIMTATSEDFLHWSEPQWIDFEFAPDEQLYTNQIKPYYRAPHLYLGFPARYIERDAKQSNEQLPNWTDRQQRSSVSARFGSAATDALLMTSRDGLRFQRGLETFIRPGLGDNNWSYGDNYVAWHVVETCNGKPGHPSELSLYATEDYFTGHESKLRRYTLRLDGFGSLHAPISGGAMVTRPLTFAGRSLSINYSTSAAGSLRVELQNANGEPLPGYELASCDEIYGDQVDRTVTWQGNGDLSQLKSKVIRMKVHLADADLYSFEFTDDSSGDADMDCLAEPTRETIPATAAFFAKKTVDSGGVEATLLLPPSAGNPRNSEGDFIKLSDGRILFVYTYFYGGGGDHAAARLASRSSSDGGKTWTDDDEIVVENEGDMNVMSVSLLRLKDGRIALFYLRKNSTTDNRLMMRTSSDEAKTWSEPTEVTSKEQIGYYVLNNDRVIQLKSGRLVAPVAQHNGFEMEEHGAWTSNGLISCYLSDDSGKSWRRSARSFYVTDPDGKRIASQEPGVVELADGRVMMFIRTSGGVQYFSYSSDGGETWTEPIPSSLRSPVSPASIKRIPQTGNLLVVWNDHYDASHAGGGKRTPLAAAISKDEGKTWSKPLLLLNDPDGWYCYTAIHFEGDYVLLGHCAGGPGQGSMGLSVTQVSRVPLSALDE